MLHFIENEYEKKKICELIKQSKNFFTLSVLKKTHVLYVYVKRIVKATTL